MANPTPRASRDHASSFFTQANALLRKNLIFQKRNMKTNIGLLAFPVLLCLLIVAIQIIVNRELNSSDLQCGCVCVDKNGDGKCEKVCSIEYSTEVQAMFCPIPNPPQWTPLLQVPTPKKRAVRVDFLPFTDLPDASCRMTRTCPTTILYTGKNQSFAKSLGESLFMSSPPSLNFSDQSDLLPNLILGTDTYPGSTLFTEPAFTDGEPLYVLMPKCIPNFTLAVPLQVASLNLSLELKCIEGLPLWRDSASVVNDELFVGSLKSNEITGAYDFLTSNEKQYAVNIWYNASYQEDDPFGGPGLLRIPRSVNLASNAYLQLLKGTHTKMQFEYVKEMPKQATQLRLDFSSIIGQLFFVWIIELLFPVILTYLVYEKQHRLKIMMKMHGLGDGAYWMISYTYFLVISSLYVLCFAIFGCLIGLKFFRLNDYSVQFAFFFIYINLQIALAFFVASYFSNVKTATVIGYIYVFGSGLLGSFLFQFFLEDSSFSRVWIVVMEIIPGFSLYRGIYEFSQSSFYGNYVGTSGMQWADLDDSSNGMKVLMILMSVECLVLLLVAYFIDQFGSVGYAIRNVALSFCACLKKKQLPPNREPSFGSQEPKVFVEMEKDDVVQEVKVVEQLLQGPHSNYAIICDDLKKMYPGRDGNPGKFAVRGLSLALPRGECFGMLGPNGAGKTSWINMMIGLTTPTSGTAYVQGVDILTNMNKVYSRMGVCPQHEVAHLPFHFRNLRQFALGDTNWKEHLMFYGRLKNLKGSALTRAVEESLKSVNLFLGGVGDKQAGKYSGGMKRRLSVAISLIGNPAVVYMDEPTTGLDPASRNNLWNVMKRAKECSAIVLTTHSMEEAEFLCDRLGIFVDGSLQCIGNPKELRARYGGTYVLTMTTSSNNEEDVQHLVHGLSANSIKIYHLSGTQKFEMPKQEVRIADVFQAVEDAKSRFSIHAWGVADTTLEDVFIKVAKSAEAFSVLS